MPESWSIGYFQTLEYILDTIIAVFQRILAKPKLCLGVHHHPPPCQRCLLRQALVSSVIDEISGRILAT